MTGKKKYCAAVLLTLLLGIGTAPALSFAVDSDGAATPDLDTEVSAFGNPAQAQHAANLAQQAANSDASIQNALQDVQNAQSALNDAMQSNDQPAMSTAQAVMTDAEMAYTDALAAATGVVGSDITSMRDSGMGWGAIAHELGVQPGMLGLGHTRGKQQHKAGMDGIDPQELNEATARNMESGWSSGHGVGVQSGVHDPGTGLFDEQAMESRGRGHDTDRSSGGVSGAGGLGSGGSSGGSMGGGSGASDDHGASSGQGGTAGNSSGPGNSGGHDSAGTDGSPGNSGSSSGQGGSSDSGNSGGMGGSSSSGGQGDSGGHGGSDGKGSH